MEIDLYEAWFDGSYNNHWGNGIGYCLKKNGEVIDQNFVHCLDKCGKSSDVELFALMKVLDVIECNNVNNVIIYGDDSNLINRVIKIYRYFYEKNQSVGKHVYKSKYYTIIQKLRKLEFWNLVWIPREENVIAHELSRGFIESLNV